MAWPFLNGTIKLRVTFGFDGVPSVNIHFVLERTPSSPIDAATLLLAANDVWTAYNTDWKDMMGDQWTIDNITATDHSLADGQQIQTSSALPIVGTGASEEVPASVCIVASHRTDHTGRSRRGRTYLPGLTEGNVGGNDIDGLMATAVGDLFTTLHSELDANDLDHVVYSLYQAGAARTTPLATLITSLIVDTRVDTQRRRLPD